MYLEKIAKEIESILSHEGFNPDDDGIKCPECDHEYVHILDQHTFIEGGRTYHLREYQGECGHIWITCEMEYSGQIYQFVISVKPKFEALRISNFRYLQNGKRGEI